MAKIIRSGVLVAAAWCLAVAGCDASGNSGIGLKGQPTTMQAVQVPHPLDELLPRKISIHPFTGTRTFDEAGGIRGIDVRIEAEDYNGDTVKAFGDFRFELHHFQAHTGDPTGALMATWDVRLSDPKVNALHWDKITRTYKFKLQWDKPIPVGQRFVLAAVFSSPFTDRLVDSRVFISGQ